MEELLAFMGFSFGAALGTGVVRTLQGGLRSAAVQIVKAGLAAGEVVGRAGTGFSEMAAEAREESAAGSGPRRVPRRRRTRVESGRSSVQTIPIVQEA